jgi:hypothetical protein
MKLQLATLFLLVSPFAQSEKFNVDKAAIATQQCLSRIEPLGNDGSTVDKIPLRDFLPPRKGEITIYESANDECSPGDECYVEVGEVLKLDSDNLLWRGNSYQMRPHALTDRPKFLVGEDTLNSWDLYLIYMTESACKVNPQKLCKYYRFEVHPKGKNVYPRPTEPQAPRRLKVGACNTIVVEPGGGNGVEPPP